MKTRQRTVCHTCRDRKLGCDGQTPSCSQCLKSSRLCGGYQYDLIFVDPVTSVKSKQRRRKPQESSKLPDACIVSYGIPRKGPSWQLNDVLSLVAQNFIPAHKMTTEHPKPLKTLSRICGSWIETVPQLRATGQQGIALQASMKAFAVAILSEKSRTSASTVDALAAHGTAIRSIHVALRNRQISRPNELLAAIMFLLLSEVCLKNTRPALYLLIKLQKFKIIFPSASSSDVHVAGLAELMHFQGPSYYTSGLPHSLFTGLRPSLVVWSIFHRRAVFLGTHDWSTVPFRHAPADPLQSLMSIGARIASELEATDRLIHSFDTTQALSCLYSWTNITLSLSNWKDSYTRSNSQQCRFDSQESTSTDNIGYYDITEANCLTHYWAFCIVCAVQTQSLRGQLTTSGVLPPEVIITESGIKSKAILIMRSVEYLTREEMKLYGRISLLLPLKVAYEYFEDCGESTPTALFESNTHNINRTGHDHLKNFLFSDCRVLRPMHSIPCKFSTGDITPC